MHLLDVENLTTHFHTRGGIVRAVDGVSFTVDRGQTVGIVGESGSGKSVSCYSLLGLIPRPPGKIEAGKAVFDDCGDLLKKREKELQKIRGKRIGMIFQDPMTSLNPFLKISTQLTEPLKLHFPDLSKSAAREKAIQELEAVGIPNAAKRIDSYPHEFSGGMRQRVMIAMAMIARPDLLIADEPTTALDVTIQKQVLELIKSRQEELGTAVIFITHDLTVVSEVCDYVNVMYAGRIVEAAPKAELFSHPKHAYTRALLRSIPALQSRDDDLYTIPGLPPNMSRPIAGCAFRPRCETDTADQCLVESRPPLVESAPDHWVQDCPGCLGPWTTFHS